MCNGDVFIIPTYACMEDITLAQRHTRSTIIPLQIQVALTTLKVGFASLWARGAHPFAQANTVHNANLASLRKQAQEANAPMLSVAWENLSPVNLEATSAPRTPT